MMRLMHAAACLTFSLINCRIHVKAFPEVVFSGIRAVDQLFCCSGQHNLSFVYYIRTVGHAQRFAHIVVGYQDSQAAFLHFVDDILEFFDGFRVDSRERLIEQDKIGLVHQGSRDLHAATLATGKRIGHALAEMSNAEVIEKGLQFLPSRRRRQASRLQDGHDVLFHGQLAENRHILGQIADSFAGSPVHGQTGNIFPVEKNLAVSGLDEPHHHIEGGRFSGAVGTKQSDNLSFVEFDGDFVYDAPAAVLFNEILGRNARHGTVLAPSRRNNPICGYRIEDYFTLQRSEMEGTRVSTHIHRNRSVGGVAEVGTDGKHRVSARRLLIGAILLLPLAVIWGRFLGGDYRSFKVISGSMIPTLEIGDCVLMTRVAQVEDLHGRTVVFRDPRDRAEMLTKRVLGEEGDSVRIQKGVLSVNGSPEPATRQKVRFVPDQTWVVGPNEVFVVGDNRSNSYDSIDYGAISKDLIVGVVAFRYWPLSRVGRIL